LDAKKIVLIFNVKKNYAKNLNTFENAHLKFNPLFRFLNTPLQTTSVRRPMSASPPSQSGDILTASITLFTYKNS